jgi:hypothetical protein
MKPYPSLRNENMKSASVYWLVFGWTLSAASHATTWAEPKPVPDPVRNGAKCHVSQPMSSGSYIYQWPSKYDQVFWPLTDPNGIWFCQESGFTAFIDDFELTDAERAAVAAELASYKTIKRPSLRQKLMLLQKSYAARKLDARMKTRLPRVLAYYYETELGDFDGARAFRRQALEMIEATLPTELPEADRLEYLFVSAVYSREFGDLEKSRTTVSTLEQALEGSKDEKLKGFVEYLTELKDDIDKIVPGGPLIPEHEQH